MTSYGRPCSILGVSFRYSSTSRANAIPTVERLGFHYILLWKQIPLATHFQDLLVEIVASSTDAYRTLGLQQRRSQILSTAPLHLLHSCNLIPAISILLRFLNLLVLSHSNDLVKTDDIRATRYSSQTFLGALRRACTKTVKDVLHFVRASYLGSAVLDNALGLQQRIRIERHLFPTFPLARLQLLHLEIWWRP